MISIERAVVVHLDDDTDPAAGRLRGRVEHVVSGRADRFESLDELLVFLEQVLRGGDDAEPGS